jgi:hypothetical protein
MTHQEAIDAQAAERYLLGELPDAARDEFEEHYFDCPICADDIRSGSTFIETLRAEGRRTRPFRKAREARQRRFAAPLAAAASLIVAIGVMQLVYVAPLRRQVNQLEQPYAPVYQQLRAVRGASPEVSAGTPVRLEVALPPDSAATGTVVTCTIVDAQGRAQGQPIQVPPAEIIDNAVTVILPPHALAPGNYTIHIDGINPPAPPQSFTVTAGSEGPRR